MIGISYWAIDRHMNLSNVTITSAIVLSEKYLLPSKLQEAQGPASVTRVTALCEVMAVVRLIFIGHWWWWLSA